MATYTKTVDPNGGADYPNIATWEAGEQTLYSSGDIAFADLYRTGPSKDTTAVTVAGWNAGVVPKIIVNAAHRHEGKWPGVSEQRGDGKYVYTLTSPAQCIVLSSHGGQITINGLTLVATGTGNPVNHEGTASVDALVDECILYLNTTTTFLAALNLRGTATSPQLTIRNSLLLGSGAASTRGVFAFNTAWQVFVQNTTVSNFANGLYRHATGSPSITATNTVVVNCSGNDFEGTFAAASDYNVSSDATAPGTNKATGKTAYADYFIDHAAGDFRHKDSSQNLWGIASANLTATFTTDILGTVRPNSDQFGIGAHLYVAAGGGPTTYPCSVVGVFPSPGGSLATASRFGQAVFGDAPAPSGSISKKTSRLLLGDAPAPSGSISKKTSRLLLGDAPAASGTLSERYRTTQSTSGIMGTITGALAAVFDAGGGVISRIWQRIKIGIGIGI